MSPTDKPIGWLEREVKTPPLSLEARVEAGYLLRLLQKRMTLSLPQSRPMPSVGARCHELRINDVGSTWRVLYRIDSNAIVVLHVFAKKTPQTPKRVVDICRRRLREYDAV